MDYKQDFIHERESIKNVLLTVNGIIFHWKKNIELDVRMYMKPLDISVKDVVNEEVLTKTT